MKNRYFKGMRKEDRESILLSVLRRRTDGMLKPAEEASLLSAISCDRQVSIKTTSEPHRFQELKAEKGWSTTFVYGEAFQEDPNASVAIMQRDVIEGKDGRVVIYIPLSRKLAVGGPSYVAGEEKR